VSHERWQLLRLGGFAMPRIPGLLVAVIGFIPWAGAAAGGDSPAEQRALTKEVAQLQGVWKVIAVTDNGDVVPDDKVEREVWTINGTSLRIRDDSFVFRLDLSTDPKLFDLALSDKDLAERNKVIEGVYAVKGDTLGTRCGSATTWPAPTLRKGTAQSRWRARRDREASC
jgi:uncharacterized protein (TIGR03067 family)